MAVVWNLSKNAPTKEQADDGLRSLNEEDTKRVRELLTFDWYPSGVLHQRMRDLVRIAKEYVRENDRVFIDPPVWFVHVLETNLIKAGIYPVYSFRTTSDPEKHVSWIRGGLIFE